MPKCQNDGGSWSGSSARLSGSGWRPSTAHKPGSRRESGVSPGYLSTLITQGRAPSGCVRRRLQAALGIKDFGELFFLEDRDENA